MLPLAASGPVGPEDEEQCARTIEDSDSFCDDGDFKIELPLCAIQELGIDPFHLFMSKKLISLHIYYFFLDSENCKGQVIGHNLVFDARRENCHVEPLKKPGSYVFNATIVDAESNSIITRNAGIVSLLNRIFLFFLNRNLNSAVKLITL
jgi:hypothetical protein